MGLTAQRARWIALICLALSAVSFLSATYAQQRFDYLSRGLPDNGLPTNRVAHSGAELGLNVDLYQFGDVERVANLERMAFDGIRYIKQPFYYDEQFDWNAADQIIQDSYLYDLQLIPQLDGNPDNNFAPPDPFLFELWVTQFAQRYNEDFSYYIIWDEPNLSSHWGNGDPNAAEYTAMLTSAFYAIHNNDPHAFIVAAPLAPTVERGPKNIADTLYLQQLYEAGADKVFDVAMNKPYGLERRWDDRTADFDTLNFSRSILMRDVMVANGDAETALWAGNWGWHALPEDWTGGESVWGDWTEAEQADFTMEAFKRAKIEWPWMGIMFLESWTPNAEPDDPIWGFSMPFRPLEVAIQEKRYLDQIEGWAAPGFHFADPDDPYQTYEGNWEFSHEYGADVGRTGEHKVSFEFWGTDIGINVRRGNFRGRFYVTVDGEPANALPIDDKGAVLILTTADTEANYIATEPLATDLAIGNHVVEITTERGWDQWALEGFSVGYRPLSGFHREIANFLYASGILFALATIYLGARGNWLDLLATWREQYTVLDKTIQLGATVVTAVLVGLMGWLTWVQQSGSIFRRLGDGTQMGITAVIASAFYLSPSFVAFVIFFALLFLLFYFRPAWGLAIIVFTFPFYIDVPARPMFGFKFSPMQAFTTVLIVALTLHHLTKIIAEAKAHKRLTFLLPTIYRADWLVLALTIVATISLFFSQRLDVAVSEWRFIIIGGLLFYIAFRLINPSADELWLILNFFLLGGIMVAVIGLFRYFFGTGVITAEGGILRLQSTYGSPNNVALYLDRIIPLLLALVLFQKKDNPWRKFHLAGLVLTSLAMLLTFSKGGFYLGMPVMLLIVGTFWLRETGRPIVKWVGLTAVTAIAFFLLAYQVPALAERLNPASETGFLRINLWRASWEMFKQNWSIGVGLDNFLYEYRGRYIFSQAWKEPNLSHPHNLFLDFSTRLGIFGLAIGLSLFWTLYAHLRTALRTADARWQPVIVGLFGTLGAIIAHGMVDHSFFLPDLAFAFYFLLATAIWLTQRPSDA